MLINQFLLLAAALFCIGVYGVIVRKNGILVLMSIEIILNAVNINLVAFGAMNEDITGQVFGTGGERILLLDQPAYGHGMTRPGGWTLEEIQAHFKGKNF